ncbi:MAG: sigma-70 family RNA polymerase sigma factor [Oscillospiraceae bacterium]|nr:sigma-70 family RNA polymerase sigma factor [Oscillospiraceae bacterium]
MFLSLIGLALQNLIYMALHLERGGTAFPKQLSKEDERKYVQLAENGDHEARNKLIVHNLRLVAYIVKKHYPDSKEQEDLISIGTIGLISAARTFKSERQINFSTYASKCIDNQIKMYFRKTNKNQNEILINEPIDSDNDGNQITLADIFRDPTCVEEITELRIDLQKLYNYINVGLEPRERQIICNRYGLVHSNKNGIRVEKAMTQQEVAKSLDISRSYVSRIEKKALEKLRERFVES